MLLAEGRLPECWIPPARILECRALLELYNDLRRELPTCRRPGSAGDAGKPGRTSGGPAQLTGPAGAAALIDQLRADGTVLNLRPGEPDPARRRSRRTAGHHRHGRR
jgi:hypothetical protein